MQQSTTSFNTISGDFECFQNFTSAEIFIHQLAQLNPTNSVDISQIIRSQKQMLQRFEKTNEMLLNVNALSQSRLKNVTEDYKKHSKLLIDMKKDLEYIFKKIRNIKSKLESKYPEAFEKAKRQNLDELDEDVKEDNITYEQLESINTVDNGLDALDNS